MQTRDQRMAQAVYDRVRHVQPDDREKYKSMAQKLPILIRTAGLAQAFAFAHTRERAQQQVLEDLAMVLGYNDAGALARKSREVSLREYIWLTQESLAALLWFKRHAQSIFGTE